MKGYSYFDKILHRQFLGDNSFSNQLYERLISKSKIYKNVTYRNNIFITGLARSGTTALLNKIYATKEYGSLRYKYMPFIFAPKITKFFDYFNKSKETQLVERFHKDGIKINTNSPECLDEIFWLKTGFKGKNCSHYKPKKIKNELLRAYSILLDSYSDIEGDKNLVIKNNNNHLRIKYLSNFFKKSYFFIMFRDPISHAYSLLCQHINFLKQQEQDPFILEYMDLIGHNEFGKNVIPFVYDLSDHNWYKERDKLSIDYWLEQWIKTYSWIFNNKEFYKENVFLISYEKLCSDDILYKRICKLVGISNENAGKSFINANNSSKIDKNIIDKDLIKMAKEIYEELEVSSF